VFCCQLERVFRSHVFVIIKVYFKDSFYSSLNLDLNFLKILVFSIWYSYLFPNFSHKLFLPPPLRFTFSSKFADKEKVKCWAHKGDKNLLLKIFSLPQDDFCMKLSKSSLLFFNLLERKEVGECVSSQIWEDFE